MSEERLQHGAEEPQQYSNGQAHPVVRDDILKKAGEIARLLQSSEEVQHFRQAEEKVQKHPQIQQLISAMKKKQKEIVAFESLRNQTMVAKIEQELEELQEQLDNIPIVTEFQQSQVEINDILQSVMSAIRDTVSEKVHVETGSEAPPSSCGD